MLLTLDDRVLPHGSWGLEDFYHIRTVQDSGFRGWFQCRYIVTASRLLCVEFYGAASCLAQPIGGLPVQNSNQTSSLSRPCWNERCVVGNAIDQRLLRQKRAWLVFVHDTRTFSLCLPNSLMKLLAKLHQNRPTSVEDTMKNSSMCFVHSQSRTNFSGNEPQWVSFRSNG